MPCDTNSPVKIPEEVKKRIGHPSGEPSPQTVDPKPVDPVREPIPVSEMETRAKKDFENFWGVSIW